MDLVIPNVDYNVDEIEYAFIICECAYCDLVQHQNWFWRHNIEMLNVIRVEIHMYAIGTLEMTFNFFFIKKTSLTMWKFVLVQLHCTIKSKSGMQINMHFVSYHISYFLGSVTCTSIVSVENVWWLWKRMPNFSLITKVTWIGGL